jgi:hypothetical protein
MKCVCGYESNDDFQCIAIRSGDAPMGMNDVIFNAGGGRVYFFSCPKCGTVKIKRNE